MQPADASTNPSGKGGYPVQEMRECFAEVRDARSGALVVNVQSVDKLS